MTKVCKEHCKVPVKGESVTAFLESAVNALSPYSVTILIVGLVICTAGIIGTFAMIGGGAPGGSSPGGSGGGDWPPEFVKKIQKMLKDKRLAKQKKLNLHEQIRQQNLEAEMQKKLFESQAKQVRTPHPNKFSRIGPRESMWFNTRGFSSLTPPSDNFNSFHLLTSSFYPIFNSLGVLPLVMTFFIFLSGKVLLGCIFGVSQMLLVGLWSWWRDTINESILLGKHTYIMEFLLTFGFIMFIVSEACLFLTIFWCYFHFNLVPPWESGGSWPPVGILVLDPFSAPYVNTVILLSSGVTLTLAHGYQMAGSKQKCDFFILCTVIMGCIFTLIQISEYFESNYSISDSLFGNLFFFGTGFHGGHVVIGSTYLFYLYLRVKMKDIFLGKSLISFDYCAWYWHFVDIIWIFLFLGLYCLNFN